MKGNDTYMLILGLLVVLGFFALLGVLVIFTIKPENESLLNIALGGLMGSFVTVVQYFFGSSSGSKFKTELMSGKNEKQNTDFDQLPMG